ncbi:MAG: DUF5683 domain-containing protein, partial [Rikenellaceae bacterium]|nr:DUF5683 domain-containing protein [Rikenellaceae bacterium]
ERLKYDVQAPQEEQDPWASNMIRHNTFRQICFGGAVAAYIYFLGDGVINYRGHATDVKKATTLSTICPGAGQLYNGKFWKLPIVIGGLATFIYTVDWNNRGYKRYKTAAQLKHDGKPTPGFSSSYTEENFRTYRENYRRNRDLCIILTGLFYVLNIIDAHVDAHMKDYNVDDDLSMRVTPYLDSFYAAGRSTVGVGLSMNVRF